MKFRIMGLIGIEIIPAKTPVSTTDEEDIAGRLTPELDSDVEGWVFLIKIDI